MAIMWGRYFSSSTHAPKEVGLGKDIGVGMSFEQSKRPGGKSGRIGMQL